MIKRQVQDLPSAFDYAKAEASLANPSVVKDEINKALRTPGNWALIEPYATEPGVTGSRFFDQANIVIIILEWDEEHNDSIIASFRLNDRQLWKYIYKLMGKVFQVSNGRVLGLLENDNGKYDGIEDQSQE